MIKKKGEKGGMECSRGIRVRKTQTTDTKTGFS
jgi:hypothetical protein